jgi:hypothetical protein
VQPGSWLLPQVKKHFMGKGTNLARTGVTGDRLAQEWYKPEDSMEGLKKKNPPGSSCEADFSILGLWFKDGLE